MHNNFRYIFFTVITLLLCQFVLAQRIELTGTLVDGESLDDLSGVHIYTKEHIGTTSDLDGNFTFKYITWTRYILQE